MNPCEIFKELILTDYIDGEINPDAKQKLESHLLNCHACLLFAQEVKQKALVPFEGAVRKPVPDSVWLNIKERIKEEEVVHQSLSDIIGNFLKWISSPRLVPAYATMAAVIVVLSFVFRTTEIKQAKEEDQAQYLVSVVESTDFTDLTDQNFETPIEEYFL